MTENAEYRKIPMGAKYKIIDVRNHDVSDNDDYRPSRVSIAFLISSFPDSP
jgi:hypothetical protein